MNEGTSNARRATADDLPALRLIWENAGLPVTPLEKRFTEFQVLEDAEGVVAGAIGLRIARQHGLVHSEAYLDPALAEVIRPILVERIKSLSPAYSLARLWTMAAEPSWQEQDWAPADLDVLARLPPEFGPPGHDWLTLKLREEIDLDQILALEFATFKKTERERNQQMHQQGKSMKYMATGIAVVILLLAVFGLYVVLRGQFQPH
jgi:N-acetylglutamate synthase-like GNAT family acetyltransferase